MLRNKRSYFMIAAACGSLNLLGSSAFALVSTTQTPIGKDDIVLGLSVTSATNSVKLVKANASQPVSSTVTGTSWAQTFIQSVEFDNYNGFRHNAQGNLLGMNFGTTATGATLSTFQTRGIVLGQPTQPASSLFYTFNGANTATAAPERGRAGGLSISPTNTRIALSGNEFAVGTTGGTAAGKVAILDYSAAAGTGTGAAVSNYRSIEIPSLRNANLSRTQSTTWLDSNNVLVASGQDTSLNSGNLYKVTIAGDGSLSQAKVASDLFDGDNISFTNVTYEPTISPYLFISGGGTAGTTTLNDLVVVDPTDFSIVKKVNFNVAVSVGTPVGDGAINTLRETAFDSKGNLIIQGYAGSQAVSGDFVTKTLLNARDVASLTTGQNLVGLIRKDQTSDATTTTAASASPPSTVINGTSASFSGNDVAMTNIDYVNADVKVNIESGDYVQQYFGTTSPAVALRAKLAAGKIVGTPSPGLKNGVGYSVTPGVGGGTFEVKYTILGDANLSGNVNFDDLVSLAQNYNKTGQFWTDGDFTYDGTVNFDDLVSLAQNYNGVYTPGALQAAGISSSFAADWAFAQALAPEPTSLAMAATLGLILRRNRAKAST